MFISSGQNSDLRYNSFYPRWAYDQFHALLNSQAAANDWHYLDLWDSIRGRRVYRYARASDTAGHGRVGKGSGRGEVVEDE